MLLVLSERSVESAWVQDEIKKAREIEQDGRRKHVLCPVALDDSWKDCEWLPPIRQAVERYNVLDFSGWENSDVLDRQFAKLLDGLALFYPGSGT